MILIIRPDIDIYNENCIDHMQSMSDDSVDLVVTSPPYNIDIQYGNNRG